MTISARTPTGLAGGATTAASWTLPTGWSPGDYLIAIYGGKAYNTDCPTPTNYTLIQERTSGTTANAADAGSVRVEAFGRTAQSGDTNPSATLSVAPSPRMTAMLAYGMTAGGSWTVESTTAATETGTGTSLDLTGAAVLGLKTGDKIIAIYANRTDSQTTASPVLSATGCTIGAATEVLGTNVTNQGNDGSLWVFEANVTAGTATGAPRLQVTVASGQVHGAVIFIRLSEPSLINVNVGQAIGAQTAQPVTPAKQISVGMAQPTAAGQAYTDDFNRADGAAGSNWSAGSVVSNQFSLGGSPGRAFWRGGNANTDNQYAQITVRDFNIGPMVRAWESEENYYLAWRNSSGTVTLFRSDGGTLTDLGTTTQTVAIGGTLRIEAEGTTIRVLLDGVQRHSVTDNPSWVPADHRTSGFRSFDTHVADDFQFGDLVQAAAGDIAQTITPSLVGGGGSVNVGLATEADTATAITRSKTYAVGIAAEADTATVIARTKQVATGLASEADTSTAITRTKNYAVGISSEADTSTVVVRTKQVPIGISTEADTSTAVTLTKQVAVGLASEADTGTPVQRTKTYVISGATEQDTAQPVSGSSVVGQWSELNEAFPVTVTKIYAIGQASEADTTTPVMYQRHVQTGVATEDDTATPISTSKQVSAGIAAETDTATTVARSKYVDLGQSQESDDSQPVAITKHVAVGQAQETDEAQTVSTSMVVPVGQANEADSAADVGRLKRLDIVLVAGQDTAQDIAPSSLVTYVPVGLADETATAGQVTVTKYVQVGRADDDSAAQALTVYKNVQVGITEAQDEAISVAIQRHYPLGPAAETDDAQPTTPVFPIIYVDVGLAEESDEAVAASITRAYDVDIATEGNFARPVTYPMQPQVIVKYPSTVFVDGELKIHIGSGFYV